jgi:hypothetical protein
MAKVTFAYKQTRVLSSFAMSLGKAVPLFEVGFKEMVRGVESDRQMGRFSVGRTDRNARLGAVDAINFHPSANVVAVAVGKRVRCYVVGPGTDMVTMADHEAATPKPVTDAAE